MYYASQQSTNNKKCGYRHDARHPQLLKIEIDSHATRRVAIAVKSDASPAVDAAPDDAGRRDGAADALLLDEGLAVTHDVVDGRPVGRVAVDAVDRRPVRRLVGRRRRPAPFRRRLDGRRALADVHLATLEDLQRRGGGGTGMSTYMEG